MPLPKAEIMPIMYDEQVISLSDLQWACITCDECGTSVTFNMLRGTPGLRVVNVVPTTCPVCSRQFDSAIGNLNGLANVLRELQALWKKDPDSVTFISHRPEPGEAR